ncbi:ribonuclease H2 subunit A [Nematocida sp. AWRm80]|nr:ribonuclease H2 subunit A [Nematocida sp. AWRm80]
MNLNEVLECLLDLEESVIKEDKIHIFKDALDNIVIYKYPKESESKESKSYIVGIDEAGRGPIAGPMVYGAVFWEKDPEIQIYNDSKKVGIVKRIAQRKQIISDPSIGFVIYCISPLCISLNMINNKRDIEFVKELNRLTSVKRAVKKVKMSQDGTTEKGLILTNPKPITAFFHHSAPQKNTDLSNPLYISKHRLNLNDLSIKTIIDILNDYIINKIPVTKVFIDAVGPVEKTQKIIAKRLKTEGKPISVIMKAKADGLYQSVGAASIIAKVTRDKFVHSARVQKLVYNESILDLGSGYPSDQITVEAITKLYKPIIGMPLIIRSAWAPVLTFLQTKAPFSFLAVKVPVGFPICTLSKKS